MYNEFYNLAEPPFNVTPDPRFLYFTEGHQSALNHLQFAIRQRKGFALLTGEVGTGKTTLCRKLLEGLEPRVRTALILNPMLRETQLLRAIVQEFGAEVVGRDRLGYLTSFNRFLLSVNDEGGDAVLLIDEAQDMSVELLELTRLLSNLETASQKLLQIVLVGQPELRETLRRPALRQLSQRITVRYHLGTMSLSDTGKYIRHRLGVAGGEGGAEFDDSAVAEIYRFSGGTPRLINAAADKALLAGYVLGSKRIDSSVVQLAMDELKEAA
jgi:general secretion pathway protein A